MNNFFSILLICGLFFPEQIRYWSLGVAINPLPKKVIIQKEIDLNNFFIDEATHVSKIKTPSNIYTLKTNYFIAPEPVIVEKFNVENNNQRHNVKDLILEEKYFLAAKHILYLEEQESILEEFEDWNDFYYWASFIYYNLGNYDLAYENISAISYKENNPELLFLEALIVRSRGDLSQSNLILSHIIKEFSNNDYANYAKDILIDE